MSHRILFRWTWLPLAIVAAVVLTGGVLAADPSTEAARLDRFTSPDGAGYFALSLKPGAVAAAPAHDVVVLFDTSAAQANVFRTKAIAALKATLAGLGPNDRVKLVAVDSSAVPLSAGFVAPAGADMDKAMKKLNDREPLSTTDMEKALNAAIDSFAGDSKNARAVIYIGKGSSTINLLDAAKFEALAKKLVDARIPVSSYAIGPRIDEQLLGALAAQTGGVVIPDATPGSKVVTKQGAQAQGTAEQIGAGVGQKLVAAARAAVLWPAAGTTWPDAFTEILPKNPPPLRTDRESIVIGRLSDTYKGDAALDVQMTVEGPTGPQKLDWKVAPSNPDKRNSFLPQVVERARIDGGVTMPLVDARSLDEARTVAAAGGVSLVETAKQWIAVNNLDMAKRYIDEALRINPQDREAKALKDVLAKKAAGAAAAPAPEAAASGATDLNLIGDAGDAGGAMATGALHEQRVVTQVIQAEVQNAVNQARASMATDPDTASQNLKITLERVRQAPELNPEVRNQLADVIQAALREAARRSEDLARRQQALAERQASDRERMLLLESLLRKEQKMKQLSDRFYALMDEGRYRPAEEVVAAEMAKLDPTGAVPVAATLDARMVGYNEFNQQIRVARQKGVVDMLQSVERSHIPMPDDVPIVYPDAEIWKELTARRKERYSNMDLAKRGTAEKRITDALKSPTELELFETPLDEVVNLIKENHKIEVQIDKKALDDVGIALDTLVTKSLKGISLRSALRLMLHELDLTYMIKDEVLLITTPEVADQQLTTKVYPVADLVLPIKDIGMSGMGGLGGGMGGMMSGMGGGMGMGGMGMGGMGMGGMGGMGMGGMGMGGGMGMFNIPQRLPRQIPPGGFQAFAVKDDLRVSPKSLADKAPAKIEKIQIDVSEGADPNVVWDKYFTDNVPEPAAVRDAARRLMDKKQYAHLIAFVKAALRHGDAQPWMYETLVIAMQADNRPKEDIQRAALSAVDFAQNPLDLMYIGIYLNRLGLDEPALTIFRQVAKMTPTRHEPYVYGLHTAKRLNDLEGLQWASLGILSQAWPKEQADVWKAGLFTARDVLEKLRADKRTKEAQAFEKRLDEAIQRDCVIVVKWTGEADVDIMVEEPSGSVCSLRNPRSTGGGILLGDGGNLFGTAEDGHREVYVCPRGFDGTYRLMVQRVWGRVTTGKVSVDVYTHYRGDKGKVLSKKVSLDDDKAVVAFDLKDGRRKEALPEAHVANAAAGQMAVGRQILAQQLAAEMDPRVMQSLASSRAYVTGNGGRNGFVPVPWGANGAVGYQPIIITLPEGANMMATAVVSADRRYVRITCVPLFSGVSEVHIFNMATGANTTGQGGTGGQGFGDLFGGNNNNQQQAAF